MAMDEKRLAEIEARVDASSPGPWTWKDCGARARDHEFIANAREDVPALVAEVRRLRTSLTNIRDIEEYLKGRVCACSGVGCVQCIARLTLQGREKELFS